MYILSSAINLYYLKELFFKKVLFTIHPPRNIAENENGAYGDTLWIFSGIIAF
jgi:hypothetical protein